MADVVSVLGACGRATRDLGRGDILWQALWPPLVAFALWSGVAVWTWQPASAWILANLPDWAWLAWMGAWLAHIALFLIFAPLIYGTTLLLLAGYALPRMMAIVAARDYPDLARHGDGAFWASMGNTLAAGLVYIGGWIVMLPLLLIPGMLLVLPLGWTAWLNQRTFRFDALADHALPAERRRIVAGHRGELALAGLVSAAALHVPFLNLVVPAWTGLVFVHLCLGRLRGLRREEGIWIEKP
jgi:CysZ protein